MVSYEKVSRAGDKSKRMKKKFQMEQKLLRLSDTCSGSTRHPIINENILDSHIQRKFLGLTSR